MMRAMWCPRCRADLPHGLLTCPECGEAPIDLLPPDGSRPAPRSGAFGVEVAWFADAAESRAAVDLLALAGIPAEIVFRPPSGPGAVEHWVAVREEDAARAGDLLRVAVA